ncbi:MAG TPA: modification methylase NmeDIP [Chitinophagaceae bacterium]|nr:DNA cytosine methyltransferase [Pseudomonadota bacterium]HAL94723.1 modification methylase NmeDIP [Chitinophagaceae bacterium]
MKSDVFSFFSGLGFLDLGFEDEGFKIVFVNEFHQPFLEAYKYARENLGYKAPKYGYLPGSIEQILRDKKQLSLFNRHLDDTRKAKRVIGFIGGPPCPDFSIAGKQKGVLGPNGRLSRTYIELILEKRPDWFLFENVKGLWRTKKHRMFYDKQLKALREAGYALSDRLTNAICYGAPQDRDRIILIGFRNGRTISHASWDKYFSFDQGVLKDLPWPKSNRFGIAPRFPHKIPESLTVSFWFKRNNVEIHSNSLHCFTPRSGLARFESVFEGDDSRKSFKRLHRYRYSPTAAYGNNEVHLHPWLPRRISAAEALAIQSLPAGFELPSNMTLSNMFKGIGNGVPYLMARGLAKMISDHV